MPSIWQRGVIGLEWSDCSQGASGPAGSLASPDLISDSGAGQCSSVIKFRAVVCMMGGSFNEIRKLNREATLNLGPYLFAAV